MTIKTQHKNELRNGYLLTDETIKSEDGEKILVGYVVKWGKKSHPIGNSQRFEEQFKRGAFIQSLKDDDQRFLWSHDPSRILGRTKNGTLTLEEDPIGLRFEIKLPNTSLGNDAYKLIKRGDVNGISFGFQALETDIDNNVGDYPVRTIKDAKLVEVSVVSVPAYPDSKVSPRSNASIKKYSDEDKRRKKLLIKTYL